MYLQWCPCTRGYWTNPAVQCLLWVCWLCADSGGPLAASVSPPLLQLLLLLVVEVLREPGSLWLIPSMTDRQPYTALSSLLACSLHPMVCSQFSTNTLGNWMELERMNSVKPKWIEMPLLGCTFFSALNVWIFRWMCVCGMCDSNWSMSVKIGFSLYFFLFM